MPSLPRDEWLDLARDLDWTFSYVTEREVYPEEQSGRPWLDGRAWSAWEEPYRTSYHEYVTNQSAKDAALAGVSAASGRTDDVARLPKSWRSAVKLHAATLPLAEFAAVIGNLRGARFGRHSKWRNAALLGALDELRHTQIPLSVMHDLVKWDPGYDWTHKLYHSNDWVAIAGRHLVDELLLGSNAIEFAIATNFVFETGFTNLQFIGLSSLAREVGDRMFESMLGTIQSDEARHAQIGLPVLSVVLERDPEYAQYLLDKWFWRSWLLFAIVTGFAMDYLTPLENRSRSFREFVQEWVVDQYLESLEQLGLQRPWYWDFFERSLSYFHHMLYASAYTYRATVWFDLALPGPKERAWLRQKYPQTWDDVDPIWERITERWSRADVGNDFAVHGTAIIGFCDLCQLVLCQGTPQKNEARIFEHGGRRYIFCSEPCRWIFEREPKRYASHKDIVKRVLAGEAPANLIALLRYFGLDFDTWGKDVARGDYPWISRRPR